MSLLKSTKWFSNPNYCEYNYDPPTKNIRSIGKAYLVSARKSRVLQPSYFYFFLPQTTTELSRLIHNFTMIMPTILQARILLGPSTSACPPESVNIPSHTNRISFLFLFTRAFRSTQPPSPYYDHRYRNFLHMDTLLSRFSGFFSTASTQ